MLHSLCSLSYFCRYGYLISPVAPLDSTWLQIGLDSIRMLAYRSSITDVSKCWRDVLSGEGQDVSLVAMRTVSHGMDMSQSNQIDAAKMCIYVLLFLVLRGAPACFDWHACFYRLKKSFNPSDHVCVLSCAAPLLHSPLCLEGTEIRYALVEKWPA